jgi:hypothetical protein
LINLPESPDKVAIAYLWGEKLYTEADETLYVYSLGNLNSLPVPYPLGEYGLCYSALITENRLYLGGYHMLHIFEVTPSLTPVTQIPTESIVIKILRVGDDLLLG